MQHLKSLLKVFHPEIKISDQQRLEIYFFLFSDGAFPLSVRDERLLRTIGRLKVLVDEHKFRSTQEILSYYSSTQEIISETNEDYSN